ncbi:zinc finger protein 845-like [Anoplophora glabripennis]|uniref:zinc finger protein 845-like n=1 Tax=Anoplophora glabripennis TaxID=217634 RepID=UPI0008748E61|nr:zinc finger protein 845-like [Anoplophora glabripennis]
MTDFKNFACRLCLKTITNTNFEIIDDDIRNILSALLLELKRFENKELICNACNKKLNAAFDFKSMCRNTNKTVISNKDCENMLQLDLGAVYMKEKASDQLMDISCDQKVCGLCMQLVKSEFRCIREEELEAIQKFVPEMVIKVIKGPVVCKPCFDSLCTHNSFLKDCLEVEEKIRSTCDSSALESQSPSDLFVKIEQLGELCETDETEMSIKTECIEIKPELDEEDGHATPENSASRDLREVADKSKHDSGLVKKTKRSRSKSTPNQVPYKCGKCVYETKSESRFTAHYARHIKASAEYKKSLHMQLLQRVEPPAPPPQSYKCDYCNFETKYKCSVNRHQLIVHEKSLEVRSYKCSECDFETRNKYNLTKHLSTHDSISRAQKSEYKCESCDYKTNHKFAFKRHQQKHVSSAEAQNTDSSPQNHQLEHEETSIVTVYSCNDCHYKTKHRECLVRHMVTHRDSSVVRMFSCNDCDYKTKHKDCLKRHMVQHKDLTRVQMYKCDACDYESRHKMNLTRHLTTHKDPSQLRMYKCNDCDYETTKRVNIKYHVFKHRDPSRLPMYKCHLCDYQAQHKINYNGHMLMHKDASQVQMFRCDLCDFETKYRRSLGQHKLIHEDSSDVPTYSCKSCNFQTKYKRNLISHEQIHSKKVQMYKCDKCDFETRHKIYLPRHRQRHDNPEADSR